MQKFNGKDTYFVADTHFLHNKNFLYGARGFSSVEEHDVAVIKSINDVVPPNSNLFHLGDLCLNTTLEQFESLIAQIQCQNIYLMMGNHPNPHYKNIYIPRVEEELGENYIDGSEAFPLRYKNIIYINHLVEIRIDKQIIVLCHYPLLVWNHSSKGSWMLCGHSHSDCNMTNGKNTFGKILDVGFDEWKKPLSFSEVKTILDQKPIQKVDHH